MFVRYPVSPKERFNFNIFKASLLTSLIPVVGLGIAMGPSHPIETSAILLGDLVLNAAVMGISFARSGKSLDLVQVVPAPPHDDEP